VTIICGKQGVTGVLVDQSLGKPTHICISLYLQLRDFPRVATTLYFHVGIAELPRKILTQRSAKQQDPNRMILCYLLCLTQTNEFPHSALPAANTNSRSHFRFGRATSYASMGGADELSVGEMHISCIKSLNVMILEALGLIGCLLVTVTFLSY